MLVRGRIKRWWTGKFVPYENDPASSVVFMGGSYARHWTSRTTRALAAYAAENHRWIIGTAIGAIGVATAVIVAARH
jgi:hypothetical protein